jgi:hypothetical protein
VFFAVACKLWPQRCDFSGIRNFSTSHTLCGNDSSDAFTDGECIDQLVLIPRTSALRISESTPKINDSTTVDRDTDRSTDLVMLNEVIDEGFANRLESRVYETLCKGVFAQRADFSRM